MINRNAQKIDKLLGVRLTSSSIESVLRKITVDIRKDSKFYVVTPNPEIIMAAQKDSDLRLALNASQLAIPDGIGIAMASKYLQLKAPKNKILKYLTLLIQGLIVGGAAMINRDWLERDLKIIPGRILFLEIIKIANKNKWKVFFLGGVGTEAQDAKRLLEKNYRGIKIVANKGPMLSITGTPLGSTDKIKEVEVINQINTFRPHMLFVGISHPRQEKWLYRWHKSLNIKGAMTVGGTFRYMAGQYNMPPKVVSRLGLEWIWRLLTGSQKFSRVWDAVVIFPLQVFTYRLKSD